LIPEQELREVVRRVIAAREKKSEPTDGGVEPHPGPPAPANPSRAKQLALGADHGGYELKERLKPFLTDLGWSIDDCGTWSEQPVDYPKIALAVALKVLRGEATLGIMIDSAGIGSAMAANKVPGIRAALCHDPVTARSSREHNDANLLTLGGKLIGLTQAQEIIRTWLGSECREERHRTRVRMIEEIETRFATGTAVR
jgi:ribose 5-phosphate isomerase B